VINYILLKPASDLFEANGKIEKTEDIRFLLPIMSNVDFFIKSCPENIKLTDFIRNCIENFNFVNVCKGDPVFHFGNFLS
jgi:hypothetical protein